MTQVNLIYCFYFAVWIHRQLQPKLSECMSAKMMKYTNERCLSLFSSETETPFHVAEPPVPSVRVAVVQSVRPAAEHQLPRRLAQPNAEVRAAALHRATLP